MAKPYAERHPGVKLATAPGDHPLDRIDPEYPVFVLGEVIIDRAYARTVLAPRLRQLKNDFFDDPNLILHTTDIVRAKNGFETLRDPALKREFYQALNTMMRELDYKVVACVIKKQEHLQRYRTNALDPYIYSLYALVERFCEEPGDVPDGGFICAEKRGIDLGSDLNQAWARIIEKGTELKSDNRIDGRIIDLGMKDKRLNIAGLQLAVLVVSPLGRTVMGKPTKEDWEIVKSKFRRSGSRYEGFGLVIRN